MQNMTTPSGKPFQFRKCPEGEIIVYPSDKDEKFQDREALVITPYTINLIADAIRENGRILMGASRDNPPKSSLGSLLKDVNQTPQQLSYLTAILESDGFCRIEKEGKAFVIIHRR